MRSRRGRCALDPYPVDLTRPIPFTALEVAILEDALQVYAAMADANDAHDQIRSTVTELRERIGALVDHDDAIVINLQGART